MNPTHAVITLNTLDRITALDLRTAARISLEDGTGTVELYRQPHGSNPSLTVETLVVGGYRAGQAAGGDACWGDWDAAAQVLTADARGPEGEVVRVGLDGVALRPGRFVFGEERMCGVAIMRCLMVTK